MTDNAGAVFSYKLRYIVGFWLVETAVSTNQKPTMYRNLYENTAPGLIGKILVFTSIPTHTMHWPGVVFMLGQRLRRIPFAGCQSSLYTSELSVVVQVWRLPGNIDSTSVQCWSTVYDAGRTLKRHLFHVSCALGTAFWSLTQNLNENVDLLVCRPRCQPSV